MQLSECRLRLRVEAGVFYGVVDVLTGEVPRFWSGCDLRVELGLFYRKELLDVSNLETITVALYDETRSGLPFLTQTIQSANINATLTLDQWDAATHQHAAATFANSQTNLAIGSRERKYWLAIGATTKTTGKKITAGAGPLIVVEDGLENESDGPGVESPSGAYWRVRDGVWQAYFEEDDSWRPFIPHLVDGQPTIGFGDPV